MSNEMTMTKLRSLMYRMKMLMDEYELRQVDIEAGPLLDEVDCVLDEDACSYSVN